MRSLTFDEMNYVSGGGNAPGDDTIIVTGFRYQQYGITAGSASGILAGFNGFSLNFGDLASVSENIEKFFADINQWLADHGVVADPNEIVVTARLPVEQPLGLGYTIRDFGNGPDALYYNGQYVADVKNTPTGQVPDYIFEIRNPTVSANGGARGMEGGASISPNSSLERNLSIVNQQ